MIVYSLLACTLLLAVIALVFLFFGVIRARSGSYYTLATAVVFVAFVYLYGVWVLLSVYARFVFLFAALICMVVAMLQKVKPFRAKRLGSRKVVHFTITTMLGLLCVMYFTGSQWGHHDRIDLAFPFKSGTYFVLQGGAGLPTNVMHAVGKRRLPFAMDIVKLDKSGRRANVVFSTNVRDYYIFGDTLYSPCAGKIIMAVSANPDNTPPIAKRGKYNTNGVVIETDSNYICLVHMQQGSLLVHEGDRVRAGDPLGCAGNSGFSIEPHLHIQAHKKTHCGKPWYQEPPVEIAFRGNTYYLFEQMEVHP